MRLSRFVYILIISAVLAGYYLYCGIYLNHLGYFNQESLFYIEKARIIFQGLGDRLKVMGLTAPIVPFYATFVFTSINFYLAPVITSAIGTAVLFNLMANTLVKKAKDDFYLIVLLLVFLLHPSMIYVATSGKSIYCVLIFFYLFYLNILRYYSSNTTFHISIASMCLLALVFCDYKFIWLTLFFIPLTLSISVNSLNLSEKESIFRLFISFNNSSLRRKLINKTVALYIIIFLLPVVSVLIYKMLNLTHANDLNYFLESPYATWSVLTEKVIYNTPLDNTFHQIPEVSILTSIRVIIFCPLILVAIYLFRQKAYQTLTLLTPFAFIEFLRLKYDKAFLAHQYYLIFLIFSLLCVIYKATTLKNQKKLKIVIVVVLIVQLYTGLMFLQRSNIGEEQNYATTLIHRTISETQTENLEVADYINSLGGDVQILVDDGVAYPIVAFVTDIPRLILPYQLNFLTAIESPKKYTNYILIATSKNPYSEYTQLTDKYLAQIKAADGNFKLLKIHETNNWILYRVL